MRHSGIAITALVLSVLLCSCVATGNPTLMVSPMEDGKGQSSGNVAALLDDGLQMVVASSYFDGHEADFLVSFASTDDSIHHIEERDLSIYGGNHQTGEWDRIGSWNSDVYIKAVKARNTTGIIMSGIVGTMAVLDAILNPDSDSSIYVDLGYSYHRYPNHRGYFGFSFGSSDPAMKATSLALDTVETTIALSQLSSMEVAELSSTLLTSGPVTGTMNKAGLVRFAKLPKYPDYKLVYDNGNQNMEFTFSRSDREEIINPWKEKSGPIYALNYNYTFGTRRNNVSFAYLAPRNAGFFIGVSFFPPLNAERQQREIGVSAGISWKMLQFFWLQGGVELQKLNGSDDYDILGLIGLEYCIYHYSFYGGMAYSRDERSWYGEAGIGFSMF